MNNTRPQPWSDAEVRLVVDDYIAMLKNEALGIKYSKAATRRALLPKLNHRSEGSIEMKRMNISAVLRDLGRPYIAGYKPGGNYQKSLVTHVKAALGIQ